MAETQVAVIGSHPVLSEAICEGLAEFGDLRAVAADSFLNNIAEFVANQHPDVLVLDAELARADGGLAMAQLHVSENGPAVVLLSNDDNPEQIDAAVQRGASAFVLKVPPAAELADAIRYAARGEMWLSPPLLTQVLSAERDGISRTRNAEPPVAETTDAPAEGPEQLTADERAVLDLLVDGMDHSQIASQLALSRRSVNKYLQQIRTKLGVKSSRAVTSMAKESGVGDSH
jgi:DNA-binding NarL/FixJ family response regulator